MSEDVEAKGGGLVAEWASEPGEVRQWTFIVSDGLVHENLNCDGVWNEGHGPELTVLVEVVGGRGHDAVLGEVLAQYGAALCSWCYASRLAVAGAAASLPRSRSDRGADALRAKGL